MKKIAISMAAVAAAVSMSASAGSLSGSLLMGTDYSFRGVSQTDRSATVQGSVTYNMSPGFYIGVAGSNIDTKINGANMEQNIYGGFAGSVAGIDFDAGVMHYRYPDNNASANTTEAYGALSYQGFGAKVSYSMSDYFGAANSDGTVYAMGSYTHQFADVAGMGPVAVFGTVGRTFGQGGVDSYTDWSVGATKTFGNADVTVAYVDTNIDNVKDADSRIVATVGFKF